MPFIRAARAVVVAASILTWMSVYSCAGPAAKPGADKRAAGEVEKGPGAGDLANGPAGDAAPNAAPNNAPKNATGVVGTWGLRSEHGTMTFEFAADGSGAINGMPIRWRLENGTLSLTVDDEPTDYSTVLGEGTLTLSGGDLAQAVTLQRMERSPGRSVAINRVRLGEDQIRALEQRFQVRVMNGNYWYDRACGAWGLEGGPTLGFVPAGLDLGGPLRSDASAGRTGVFINGREIHPMDVASLQQLTPVIPGRYWVDARGLCGYEGDPTPILDLAALAQAARSRSGGAYHSRNDFTGIGSGGDGKTSYVMGKDWSVIIGE